MIKVVVDKNLPYANDMEDLIHEFLPYAEQQLQYDAAPSVVRIVHDEQNASNPLGKTAFYNPEDFSVVVYGTGRHVKDVLRSLSHELVHHAQNCRGDMDEWFKFLEGGGQHAGYAQNNEHMREMEREAYERGNMIFRDWEDERKKQHSLYEGYCKRNKIPFKKDILLKG